MNLRTQQVLLLIICAIQLVAMLSGCSKVKFDSVKYNTSYLRPRNYHKIGPPGTIKVSENYFVDKTELSNLGYKEYLFELKRTYSVYSKEYQHALIDSNTCIFQNFIPGLQDMLRSPAFDESPVIGITLDQAKKIAAWRTNKVSELILIERNKIELNPVPTPDNHFTLYKYFNNEYDGIIELDTTLLFPVYTVPTLDEWMEFSGINSEYHLGHDVENRQNKAVVKVFGTLFNTIDRDGVHPDYQHSLQASVKESYPFRYYLGPKNIQGLYNIIGNVAELVDSSGIAKGGDWLHPLDQADLYENRKINIPNCYTGVRMVCRYMNMNEIMELYEKGIL